ncbi:MAG: bifunctional 5,10-methylenetetrahydrofolate dehydrogenase/5,10-methenyltetrahydrofolate cyclohydrolase [Tissierellia bacterium]|nr:bifunctional 5,10-methylenetetrahydrofolate dehydrogenase/5,10-methenyltetrahydrofolate cyclohydrolase [Tissierellia bacterium]
MKLEGKNTARRIVIEIKEKVHTLKEKGITPTLMTCRIGEDGSSKAYEKGLKKRCDEVGIQMKSYVFSEDDKDKAQLALEEGSKSDEIGGILLLQPIPKSLDPKDFIDKISPKKDVDCVRMENQSKIYCGDFTGHCPSTPLAVMEILKDYHLNLSGKNALIINRTTVVGRPLAMMLLKEDATVTLAHSKTKGLKEMARKADYIFTAMGKSHMIDKEWVSPHQYIIDIGIAFDKDGKLTGDVDEKSIKNIVKGYSPVPGGVGSVTNALLLKQVLNFYS